MSTERWQTQLMSVASLYLDPKNPRLGQGSSDRSPRDIIQYLFDYYSAIDVAESIATRGFFQNEPLTVIKENGKNIVVEGNRRLASLKALQQPNLVEGRHASKVARLSNETDRASIAQVPVIIAPTRREADKLLSGRHVGRSVLAWTAEDQSNFILDKLETGYTESTLEDELGFTSSDIQRARQIRAIRRMTRSLSLDPEVKSKLTTNPRDQVFTTIDRIFESSIGRKYLMVEPHPKHGIVIKTARKEFERVLSRLATDVARGNQSSRTLNTNDEIGNYFESWGAERPQRKRGSFTPENIISKKSAAALARERGVEQEPVKPRKKPPTVLPHDLNIRHGGVRLRDIGKELQKLRRDRNPNAGIVLLRVFLELTIVDYLERSGKMESIISKLERNNKLPQHGLPNMKQLAGEATNIAKDKLSQADYNKVASALKYDHAAPFTIASLNAFIHSTDIPSERDIYQFCNRIMPLLRLMLEQDLDEAES